MATDPRSPFCWRDAPRPSIFADDVRFLANKSGKSASQTAVESVAKVVKATGKNPGTIKGISRAERKGLRGAGGAYLHRSGSQ